MTQSSTPSTAPASFKDALRFWTKLGFISFGGPAGQIAIMHQEVVARRGWIETVHLPPFLRGERRSDDSVTIPLGSSVADAERKLILETLKQMDGNKTRAARVLGLDVRTIRYKLRAYEDET